MNSKNSRFPFSCYVIVAGTLLALLGSMPIKSEALSEIKKEIRLSKWIKDEVLKKKGVAYKPYLPGFVWMVTEESYSQKDLKKELLRKIKSPTYAPQVSRVTATRLADFVSSFATTGRVVIENTDFRWLEVNPLKNPILKIGHQVHIPKRPSSVTVVDGNGRTCQALHSIKLYAVDYARKCDADGSPQIAWIVQSDGLIQKVGVASWNQQEQNPPAPGAWIVIADANIPWPYEIMEHVARLLATQGVAEDLGHSPIAPVEMGNIPLGETAPPRNNVSTYNDWGVVGLLQTPTARMKSAGNASLSVSMVEPYMRINGNIQVTDWMELGVRWTDIRNRLYGAASFSGNQSLKDKSIDLKLKLFDETKLFPEVAAGLSDLGGTGLFSGEYVVSSKRTGNFDWSLGLGWGYSGARGNLGNPLSLLTPKFSVRPKGNVGQGGTVNIFSMFRGKTSLFGGVQYQTPWDSLIMKLEYDGNNYQHEPQGNNQVQKSPFNFGLLYRWTSEIDLAVNFERGNQVGLGLTFHGDLKKMKMPKVDDPVGLPVLKSYPTQEPDWQQVATLMEEKTSWHVLQIKQVGNEVIVVFQGAEAEYWNNYVDRIVSVLHRYVPAKDVQLFRIQSDEYGLGMHEFQINRELWLKARTEYIPAHHKKALFVERAVKDWSRNSEEVKMLVDDPAKRFSYNLGMYLDHSFGGPEGLLYQTGIEVIGKWNFQPQTWLTGSMRFAALDNYDKFVYPPSKSTLYRVRTDIEKYANGSTVTLPTFQLTHVGKFNDENFFSMYGGMMESMFGGVGGEWLYRPWKSPLAFGIDINAVQQRGYKQDFSFKKYRTITGHASLYWETGFQNVYAQVLAGRYLAGDYGVTLDLSRSFENGVKVGAFATKTNVSAADFGEGSFDKGIYVEVPFDTFLTRSNSSVAHVNWQPLTRDGGARLSREFTLFDMTKKQGGDLLRFRPWSQTRKTQFGDAADGFARYNPRSSLLETIKDDLENVAHLPATSRFWKSMFWIGGITAATSLIDKRVDNQAVKYGKKSPVKAISSVGKMLPLFAVAGSATAFLGADSNGKLSATAYSSLSAASIGLVSNIAMKYAIGRDRPLTGKGSTSFAFLNSKNGNSSMPSNHTTVMWAAITPYAKAYDAPWLYGLAAITNFARVGDRKHWLSDTVASALFGYAIGDYMYESHRKKHGVGWQVSPNRVTVYW